MAREAPSKAPKARLFVALDLPEEAREAIVAWQQEMLGNYDRALRLVRPEALHVTLVFLGWVAADPFGHVRTGAFGGVGHMEEAPTLEPIGLKPLPPRRTRLWALSLADHGGRAAEAQARVARGLERWGLYTPEERPFWPHITVARLRAGARAPRVDVPPPPIRFQANAMTIYRSHLSRAGADYERIATQHFAPPY